MTNIAEKSLNVNQYLFQKTIDTDQFFWFPRSLITSKVWAGMSSAAKTVYPVIACHASQAGYAFPGERRIAILCGVWDQTVRRGILDLEDLEVIKVERYTTKRGKRGKRFKIDLPLSNSPDARAFPFFSHVVYGGNWRILSPAARMLYPVMRHFAKPPDGYDDDAVDDDFIETFKQRRFDIVDANINILADFSGIDRRSVGLGIQSLEVGRLVQISDNEECQILIKPFKRFSPEHLNNQIIKRYQHETIRACRLRRKPTQKSQSANEKPSPPVQLPTPRTGKPYEQIRKSIEVAYKGDWKRSLKSWQKKEPEIYERVMAELQNADVENGIPF